VTLIIRVKLLKQVSQMNATCLHASLL